MTEVRWTERLDRGWRCVLCPRGCVWDESAPLGFCRVRGLVDGSPGLPGWGRCVSLAVDPIEKKPLYHFLPGSDILSTGPAGCNLSCSFCQNWEVSQREAPTRLVRPDELAAMATGRGSAGIAFTYTEPTVWFEYIAETAPLVRAREGAVVMVSNGYVNPAPLRDYLGFTDAWNVDLKGWSRDFYRNLCGGERDAVLGTIATIAASGRHLEVTFLVIPGENDSEDDWREMARWLRDNAGGSVPLHISRYHPGYMLKTHPTAPGTIMRAVDVFSEYLCFVYPGNLPSDRPTACPSCGEILIRRSGMQAEVLCPPTGRCPACGGETGVVHRLPPNR